MKRLLVILAVTLLLSGCLGSDFLGVGRAEWNFKKTENDMLIGVNGHIANVGRRQLGIGSLVAFALGDEEVLATKSLSIGTLLDPHKEYWVGFLFAKKDVPGITHIKVVISNDVLEPPDRKSVV